MTSKHILDMWDEDIAGIMVDYQNRIFKRLAGAYDKTAGADFDQFEMFGGRKRCNVADDGTIVAYYGDEDYAEDGSMGQVMVYQPAFYYKVVPLCMTATFQSRHWVSFAEGKLLCQHNTKENRVQTASGIL